jgi:hypothetical protein
MIPIQVSHIEKLGERGEDEKRHSPSKENSGSQSKQQQQQKKE